MKKIFTLIVMAMMAFTTQAAITVYVKADVAPHIWAWTGAGNVFADPWPGPTMELKKSVTDKNSQTMEFWYYTFDESITSVGILFNNGAGAQTGDKTITSDRYYIYNGTTGLEDITENYTEIPDAQITSMYIVGNHNSWGNTTPMTEVTAGTKYSLVVDLTGVTISEDFWIFKFRPNGSEWIGYAQVTDLDVTLEDAGNIVENDLSSDKNFGIDLGTNGRIFTFTATWGGGKDAAKNWTIKVEKGNTTGISDVKTDAANSKVTPVYNLNGQRVSGSSRGVMIQNGKKVLK